MKTRNNIVRALSIIALLMATLAPLTQFSATANAQAVTTDETTSLGLHLDLVGLEDLGDGWAYEGWLIVDGAPVSTGVFTVDSDGMPSAETFAVSPGDHANATAFVLTIEPAPDDDPAPSAVHILGGDLSRGSAALTIGHPAALGTDFADAAGSYIIGLGYPEGAMAENDYTNGIWYPNSLTLPELPAGWAYEGWVVGEDGPVSTGRFTDPDAADDDGSGPTAGGPGTGPDFPGQDFFTPPVSVIGSAAVISVEPVPDNSPAPFVLKPLVDGDIEDVGDHNSQALANNAAASSPTGTVLIMAVERADVVMEEAMPEAEAADEMVVVTQGEFVGADAAHQGAGTATIFTEGDTRILRLEDFSVTNGPDLHVLLIENAGATSSSELGEYIDLGSLKGNMGDQNYEIPADVDLSKYSGVMIYCVPFHVAFSTAAFGG